jgi:hypothetical protein
LAASTLSEADFQAILTVMAQSERGRLFLAEYMQRRRDREAARLQAAVERLEAYAKGVESDRPRRLDELDRAEEVLRQLSQVLNDLRPLADAKARARLLNARESARETAKPGGLERRFAALVDLYEQDAETGLKLFG